MTNQVNSGWTPELKDRVKTLWSYQSAAQIAGTLNGEGYTFTRNSIIGVLHRANLTSKHKTEEHPMSRSAGQKRPPRSRETFETTKLRCVEIVPRSVTLIDLEPGDCRYPYGDETITFCGHPKMEAGSYCVPHFHLCRGEGTISERMATKGIAA